MSSKRGFGLVSSSCTLETTDFPSQGVIPHFSHFSAAVPGQATVMDHDRTPLLQVPEPWPLWPEPDVTLLELFMADQQLQGHFLQNQLTFSGPWDLQLPLNRLDPAPVVSLELCKDAVAGGYDVPTPYDLNGYHHLSGPCITSNSQPYQVFQDRATTQTPNIEVQWKELPNRQQPRVLQLCPPLVRIILPEAPEDKPETRVQHRMENTAGPAMQPSRLTPLVNTVDSSTALQPYAHAHPSQEIPPVFEAQRQQRTEKRSDFPASYSVGGLWVPLSPDADDPTPSIWVTPASEPEQGHLAEYLKSKGNSF
ncbi:hypothetical protein LZ30DRAFT_811633 [Colletotrichum cereale]|nr:hypothetical protein LZ30DRAFT_811633 [Colletotrichum cereale]